MGAVRNESDYSPVIKNILSHIPRRLLLLNVLVCGIVVAAVLVIGLCVDWPEGVMRIYWATL